MKIILIAFILCLVSLQSHANDRLNDSGYRKRGFHLMLSLSPVVLKLSTSNPANLFYSKIRFEPQFNYKRNFFGLGVYGTKSSLNYQINGVPVREFRRSIFLLPTYSHLLLSSRYLELYTGVGLVYKYNDTLKTSYTSIETLIRKTVVTEKGGSLFGRINYRFHRRLSVAVEFSLYLTQASSRVKENYPLTPSMSSDIKGPVKRQSIYFIPSNIFLRVSI